MVKFLTDQGADFREGFDYILFHVASERDLKMVQFLLEKGADIHAQHDTLLEEVISEDIVPGPVDEWVSKLIDLGAVVTPGFYCWQSRLSSLLWMMPRS